MPEYKVKEPGFFGGVFRTPGGKHDPLVAAKPLDPVPSWLEEIKPAKKTRKAAAAKVTVPNSEVTDFIGEDKDVETL